MTVLGIDVSTESVDLVYLNDDTDYARHRGIPLPATRRRVDEIRVIRERFPSRSDLEDNGVRLIGIEDPMSRFPHTAKALGIITGCVLTLLPTSITIVQLAPTEWKKTFTGKGNAAKPAVYARAGELGFHGLTYDAADAYGIAYAARIAVP